MDLVLNLVSQARQMLAKLNRRQGLVLAMASKPSGKLYDFQVSLLS